MKFYKKINLLLVIVIVMSLAVGCGKPPIETLTPREIIAKAIDVQANEVNSLKYKIDFNAKMENYDTSNQDTAEVAKILNGMTGSFTGESDTNLKIMALQGVLNAMIEGKQEKIDLKIFGDADKIAINVPFLWKYIPSDMGQFKKDYYVIDQKLLDKAEESGQSGAEVLTDMTLNSMYSNTAMKALTAYISHQMLDIIADEAIIDNGMAKINIAEQEINARHLTLKLDKPVIMSLMKKQLALYDDAKYIELYLAYQQSVDSSATQESVNTSIADDKKTLQESITDLDKNMDAAGTSLAIDAFLNDTFQIIKTDGSLKLTSIDPEEKGTLTLGFSADNWDFNVAGKSLMPELTDANSLNLSDLGE